MKRLFIILSILMLSVVTSVAQTETSTPQAEAENTEQTSQTQAAEATPTSDNSDVLWQTANTAYNSGDYAQAEACYTRILEQGLHSASLYYNLANAHFKQNELGKALLYYNRALRLRPNDEDIRHNLEYAKQSTKDSIEEIPEFFLKTWIKSLRGALSCTAWSILSLVMLATALAFGLIYMLAQRMSLRKTGFYLMSVTALLFVVTTAFAWSERNMLIKRSEAIVMDSAVSIKSSPDRSATELFVLHEGTKVTIGEAIDGWAEVRIADGRKGWIEDERIERI